MPISNMRMMQNWNHRLRCIHHGAPLNGFCAMRSSAAIGLALSGQATDTKGGPGPNIRGIVNLALMAV